MGRLILQLILQEHLMLAVLVRGLSRLAIVLAQCVLWPVTTVRRCLSKRIPCPAITDHLLLLPAGELARRIRIRQVSCEEVVRTYISRVQQVNPVVNAVVQDRFQEALQEAQEVDELIRSGKLSVEELQSSRPLLGVPLTVKESIGVQGMSNSAAFSLAPTRVATEDAEVVRLLREAGAIILLVSNTPELCLNWETFNPRIGTTRNPFDTRRTPGGSSGGEAALMSSAASVIGVGSDVSGSLRVPAVFSGVFGHKPSPGYVSVDGHMPCTSDPWWKVYFSLGPMCRYAADLPLMMTTMVSDKERLQDLRLDDQVELSQVRVFYMEDELPNKWFSPVDAEIKAAMRRAVSYLQDKHGTTVQQVTIEGLEASSFYCLGIMGRMSGISHVFQKDSDNPYEWNSLVLTILKRVLCLSQASMFSLVYGVLKWFVDSVSEEDFHRLFKKKENYMKQFKELLAEDGVILFPAWPNPAHFHGQAHYMLHNGSYTGLFNLTEMPATACPLGLSSRGLPIGVQIAAWKRQDRLCFAVAKALEMEFGGWIPPCATP